MMEKLFKEIHGNVNQTMIPISRFDGRYELTFGLKSYKEEVKILKEKVPHLVEHIYFVPKTVMETYYYKKENVLVEIYNLEWKFWEMLDQRERIENVSKLMENLENENDYESLFSYMEKKILITKYIELFDKIPVEQKYNCFRDLWVRSEYGFDQFNLPFLKKVFSYKEHSQERNEGIEEFKKIVGDHQTIEVFRGVTSSSTPYSKAISWTLDEDVAEFFAMRFNSKGKIMKAEINIDDVYDYMMNRNEKELLLNPKKIKNVDVHYYI